MAKPQAGRAYGVCDDEPAPPQDVVAYAAAFGHRAAALIAFEDADLSPMAKAFMAKTSALKTTASSRAGVTLKYPSYRELARAV